ncbi:alanine racemase [Oceanomicrobium pacificus]|uniref:Alanine racemase n=1 Tax=Oceanomicrobium pacificus TaxID=2692916 RepID=A0A6B0TP47_9RHOB|nr:alanine racemase [Oceanomicrobium pacificus]MXU65656.1 alanine racemase [Oceanomicrobium pacificus]
MARARLTIDLDAIAANWRTLDALSAPEVETAAVVKANAYGLGVDAVAPVLEAAGARSFFVALAEEGVAVRRALGDGPRIFVFSGLMPGDAPLLTANGLVPLLNSLQQLSDFKSEMPGTAFGIQLDSGMNRLGLEPADWKAARDQLDAMPALIMSHLACADAPDHDMNRRQRDCFAEMVQDMSVPCSLAATGGTLLGPDFHHQMVRPGIGLYGGLPFAGAAPVVTLSVPVIQTRTVEAGEAVGYGADWVAEGPRRIATVAAGYADGLMRHLAPGMALYHGATPCPIAGRVSMDLITVDVTGLPDAPDKLDILGPQQTVDDLARAAGTIGYEILTSLGDRYERVYKRRKASEN